MQVVSITSQGQLTIPKEMRKALNITGAIKASIVKIGETMVLKPNTDFWALEGSLKTNIKLSDEELNQARHQFSKKWAKNE